MLKCFLMETLTTSKNHLYTWSQVIKEEKEEPEKQFYRLRACLHEGGWPQVGEVTCGGLPHLTCKRDHIKMRDYMERRATPPKWVTSPIWGTPPPCKQALKGLGVMSIQRWQKLRDRKKFYKRICSRKHISIMSVYSLWIVNWLDRNTFFRSTSLLNSIRIDSI